MELRAIRRIDDIPATVWNGLEGTDNPFLDHAFLSALERHGAVSRETGWVAHHLGLFDGDRLVAAAPAYLKTHSWGEFVFDFAWADAYARYGEAYYPKLVIAVPFTPATGPRILFAPDGDHETLAAALTNGARTMVERAGISSVHWLFPRAADRDRLAAAGYSLRHGCQYHWRNDNYADFEDFLGRLTAKKRKNIRRERRRVHQAGVRIRTVHGDEADTALWSAIHRFYRRTFHEHGNLPLLSRAFFEDVGARLGRRVVLFIAERDGTPIAGALCFRDARWLYGRYWGCDETVEDLHFEACYYQGIDYCIRKGLTGFEPGAQGEHKVPRGFLPTITYSAHHLVDPRFREAVDDYLERERAAVNDYARALTLEGPYRAESHDTGSAPP